MRIIKVHDADSIVKFDFMGSKDFSNIAELGEYADFCRIIHAIDDFRETLTTESIETIKTLSGKFSLEVAQV